jgi:hypothetical protein
MEPVPPLLMIGVPVVVFFAASLIVIVANTAPVRRSRLERFARRQSLTITATNGNRVIAYLSVTRRWRSAGVVIGLAAGSIGMLSQGQIGVAFLPLFAGWFAGALAAEARLTYRHRSPLRRASLMPRDPSRYLSPVHRLLVPVATVVCLGVGVTTLIEAASGREVASGKAILGLLAGLVIAAAVRLTQRRALNRPQPVAEPDEIAADDAIRSRSLHVLASAGATLVVFCILYQLEALLGGSNVLISLATVVAPVVGWLLGISHWSVAQPTDPPPTSPAHSPDSAPATGNVS